MRSNKNRILSLALALVMVMGMVPGFTLTASAVSAPVQTDNIGDHDYINYGRWASPIKSYLEDNGDGTFTRVEYTGEAVTVETYDSDLQFVDGFTIDMELPIFGGFHSGENYNFLVFGQENLSEDDTKEVIRVVSYTKDWKRVGAASLYGANTIVPFEASSLRFAEYNGYLYIRTAHKMYMTDDGKNHQSNLTMNVRIADMVITDSYYKVMNIGYGYVSHSFNQFIAVDGTDLVAVDHGDAAPRSVVLTRYNAPAGQDSFMKAEKEYITATSYRNVYTKYVDVLPIMGNTGANDTGVAVGGFEISDSAYLIAGNTVAQDDTYDAFGQRNIFITATAKAEELSTAQTTVRYLTSYAEGDDVTVSTPHFVKITNDKYAILWTESGSATDGLRYAFVNGKGELISEIYTTSAVLSDCAPIVSGDKLIWYVTSLSVPTFFTIDLNDPENVTHDHIYTYSYVTYPGYTTAGELSCVCAVCGEPGEKVIIPAIQGSDEYTLYRVNIEPTCTINGSGYYSWSKLENYDVDQYVFGGTIPAPGHDMTHTEGVAATCTQDGMKDYYYCQRCEMYFSDAEGNIEITDLDAWKSGNGKIAATSHVYGDLIAAQEEIHTQTELKNGVAAYYFCDVCDTYFTEDMVETTLEELTGETPTHDYSNGICTVCGAVKSNTVVTVSKNGTVTGAYASLDEAIQAVKNCTAADKAVVTLLKDIALDNIDQNITSGVFTIDLNGKRLSSTGGFYGTLYIKGGNVTIIGNGGKISGHNSGVCAYNSTVTIIGCTISGSNSGVRATNNSTVTIRDSIISGSISSNGSSGVYVYYNSTVNISGGSISGKNYGVYAEIDGTVVNISGGSISGNTGVYAYNGSTINISGGTISGNYNGIYADYGSNTVNISGGSISGNNCDLRKYIGGSTFTLTFSENDIGATFPNGITVSGITLEEILGKDAAYWAGDAMLTGVTGDSITDKGDITVKKTCDHTDDEKSYVNNGDDHTYTCSGCSLPVTEDHSYKADTLLCACGAKKPVTVISPAEIGYTVSGQTVTVKYDLACRVGYLVDGGYVAIDAAANGDGSYSFTAPDEVAEVLLVVIGDVDQDGDLDSRDTDALGAALQPNAEELSAENTFAADVNENGKLNSADLILIGRSILETSNRLYKAFEW